MFLNGVLIGIASSLATIILVYSVTLYVAGQWLRRQFLEHGAEFARMMNARTHSPPPEVVSRHEVISLRDRDFVHLAHTITPEQLSEITDILTPEQVALVQRILDSIRE